MTWPGPQNKNKNKNKNGSTKHFFFNESLDC